MKKLYLINVLSAIMLTNTGLLIQNHNLQHNNQNQLPPNEDFVRRNGADMGDFGPLRSGYKYREFRLFIYMMPLVYTYFLASIKVNSSSWFYNSFLNKGQTPSLHSEWKTTKEKIYDLLATASTSHNQTPTFFIDKFKEFVTTRFNLFKNIFTYLYRAHNIYIAPSHPWDEIKAQEYSRANGAIFEINFEPITNAGVTTWSLTDARMAPYLNGVMLLKQYYQEYDHSTQQFVAPMVDIKLEQMPTQAPTIGQLLPKIQSRLSYLFNIPLEYFTDNRVKIPEGDLKFRVYRQQRGEFLDFYEKYGPNPKMYMRQLIELYWSVESSKN